MTDQSTAVTQVPPKRQLGPRKASDVPKRRRMSPMILEAIELMASMPKLSQKDAAGMVNCSPEHLCKQLKKDHVKDYLVLAAKRKIASAVYRASHVKVELLECDSPKVRDNVSSDILAIGGIAPPTKGHNTNVNVSVSAGYIVDWRPDLEPMTIDAKAEVIEV